MSLPVTRGAMNDVPASAYNQRSPKEEMLRRIRSTPVIRHTNPDGTVLHIQPLVVVSDEPGGPRQSAGGTDRGKGVISQEVLDAEKAAESTGATESVSGPARDERGRFVSSKGAE